MVYAQTKIHPRKNEMYKFSWILRYKMDYLITAKKPDLVLIHKENELSILRILLFCTICI